MVTVRVTHRRKFMFSENWLNISSHTSHDKPIRACNCISWINMGFYVTHTCYSESLHIHQLRWTQVSFQTEHMGSFSPAYKHRIYQVTKFSFIHDMHCIICEKQLLYRSSTFVVFYGNQIHKLAVNVISNNIDVSNLTWISSRYSFHTIFCALCYCLK